MTPPVGPAAYKALASVGRTLDLAGAHDLRPSRDATGGGFFDCPVCIEYGRTGCYVTVDPRIGGGVELACAGNDCDPAAIAEALWAGIAQADAPDEPQAGSSPNGPPPIEPFPPIVIRSARDFAAEEEELARGVLGIDDAPVIPEGGNALVYGDGGGGKTTLTIDGACHLAAGDAWLGIPVPRPQRVLIIENEGPRPHFRAKLARKLAGWTGSPIGDEQIAVLDEPWGKVDVALDQCRDALAAAIGEQEISVVLLGPISDSGMHEAGTLQQVRAFIDLLDRIREASGRPITFVLLHHENAAGKVSGAFKPAVDTLLRVSLEGNGKTRLHFEKVRWSSEHTGLTWHLRWTGVEAFEVDEQPDRTDDDYADAIVDYVRAHPGTGWVKVEKAVTGNGDKLRGVRDVLLADRRIVNIAGKGFEQRAEHKLAEGRPAHLFVPADPAIRHLCPWLDTVEDTVA